MLSTFVFKSFFSTCSILSQNVEESNQVSQRFSWVGGTKREFILKSHSALQIPLQALFIAPGVYNLSNLNIVVQSEKDFVSAYNLPPYLIVIDSTNAT